MISKRTLVQLVSCSLGAEFNEDLLMVLLLFKPNGGDFLFVLRGDENAAFGVLGSCAAVEADAGAVGDLLQDGQEALEARRTCDGDLVNECRNKVTGILERVTNRRQIFLVLSCGA